MRGSMDDYMASIYNRRLSLATDRMRQYVASGPPSAFVRRYHQT
jgi:hypothetical protein